MRPFSPLAMIGSPDQTASSSERWQGRTQVEGGSHQRSLASGERKRRALVALPPQDGASCDMLQEEMNRQLQRLPCRLALKILTRFSFQYSDLTPSTLEYHEDVDGSRLSPDTEVLESWEELDIVPEDFSIRIRLWFGYFKKDILRTAFLLVRRFGVRARVEVGGPNSITTTPDILSWLPKTGRIESFSLDVRIACKRRRDMLEPSGYDVGDLTFLPRSALELGLSRVFRVRDLCVRARDAVRLEDEPGELMQTWVPGSFRGIKTLKISSRCLRADSNPWWIPVAQRIRPCEHFRVTTIPQSVKHLILRLERSIVPLDLEMLRKKKLKTLSVDVVSQLPTATPPSLRLENLRNTFEGIQRLCYSCVPWSELVVPATFSWPQGRLREIRLGWYRLYLGQASALIHSQPSLRLFQMGRILRDDTTSQFPIHENLRSLILKEAPESLVCLDTLMKSIQPTFVKLSCWHQPLRSRGVHVFPSVLRLSVDGGFGRVRGWFPNLRSLDLRVMCHLVEFCDLWGSTPLEDCPPLFASLDELRVVGFRSNGVRFNPFDAKDIQALRTVLCHVRRKIEVGIQIFKTSRLRCPDESVCSDDDAFGNFPKTADDERVLCIAVLDEALRQAWNDCGRQKEFVVRSADGTDIVGPFLVS